MAKPNRWWMALVHEFTTQASVYGPLPMPAGRLLEVEMILTLLADHFPGVDPAMAWAVLNGHAFPALNALSEEGRRAVALARLRLSDPLGRGAWERALAAYTALPVQYTLYKVEGMSVVATPTALVPGRQAAYRKALRTPPEPILRAPCYVDTEGIYRFDLGRLTHEVEIPEGAIYLPHALPISQIQPRDTSDRSCLRVRLSDLQDEAAWMDRQAPSGSAAAQSWGARMQAVDLRDIGPEGLTASTELALDGLLHLIGMVGSGKSTLFTVLAVYLARRKYRVVILQGDVASLLRLYAVFEGLRLADESILSVPLVGRSTRLLHLNRLHAVEAQKHGLRLSQQHPSLPMFSTICPLDGLRQDVDPIPLGAEPCTRLYATPSSEDAKEPPKRDCPFLPVCPVHLPTRQLVSANIWLATPASFLASSPQTPLVSQEMRYIEMAMRYADVILVDEADAVQSQMDSYFAPFEVLVGHKEAWLDRLYNQVTRQVYRPARPRVGRNAEFDRWRAAHNNVQQAVDRLYYWLRESMTTMRWLGNTYFNGGRLLQRVADELQQIGAPMADFNRAAEAFTRNPLGVTLGRSREADLPEAWSNAIRLEMDAADSERSLAELQGWWTSRLLPSSKDARQVEQIAHHLLIALIVGVLDNALQSVIAAWGCAEEEIELDRGTGGLFFKPSDSLLRLVPEAPMGSVLGFQYFDADERGDGELRFFHVRGMGRALLYHLHDALQLTDGVPGPHVVLTSGTSWAPGSWRYHLEVPPSALLLPQREEASKGIACFFDHLPDPDIPGRRLTVSGQPIPSERMRNLRAMISELTAKQGFKQVSRFDEELSLLEEHRRRILLVVGSYEEAREVSEKLAQDLGTPLGQDVEMLVPDSDSELLWHQPLGKLPRSLVSQLAERSARFLVAPLQAIERGHNILVGTQAAIGSVYFLVRPLPRPGDPQAAIQRMNAWASAYVPTLTQHDVGAAGMQLRTKAHSQWESALRGEETYRGTRDRTALLWTQLVLVWQCIGRLLRGGVSARVHFVDAKWSEVSSGLVAGRHDTEETSMLIGFSQVLDQALADPDLGRRAVAEALYGPFATALKNVKGVHYASK